MSESHGWEMAAAFDTDGTFDSGSFRPDFKTCGIKQKVGLIGSPGMRGERVRHGAKIVQGEISVGGPLVLEPTPAELDFFLPYIMGAVEATDVFAMGDTFTALYALIDRKQKVHKYTGLVVDKATFRFRRNQPVELTIDWIGKTESQQNAGSFSAAAIDTQESYLMRQAVLTLQALTVEFEEAELSISNFMDAKFRNSQTATAIDATDSSVQLRVTVPYNTTNLAIYTNEVAASWAGGSIVLTNGARSCTFTLNSLRSQPEAPDVPERNREGMLILPFEAFKTSSTKPLSITNVST